MSEIKGSVIIPTRDKITRLRLVLEALAYQVSENIEVIVVFDGCRADVIDEFERFQLPYRPRKVVSVQNIGRAAARNLGIRFAQGEIIIFLDDDRVPGPDFILKHIASHRKHCVLIGERKQVDLSELEIEQFATDFESNRLKDIYNKAYVEFFNAVTKKILLSPYSSFRWLGLATGNVSVAREDLIAVGGFDENFTGWGYEDVDLGYRLFRLEIPFVKDSTIINYHLVHGHSHNKNYEELRNLKYFIQKIQGGFIPKVILRLLLVRLNIRIIFSSLPR